ncbi:MAG: IS110 family transposase, partial [Kiritimatiellia bacterium]
KQGSPFVRSWLVEAAWLAKSRDPVLLKKYRDALSRTNSSKKAIVAVARKLAVRLRALLISGEEYQIGVVQ